jgi:anti-anti-sigma factor
MTSFQAEASFEPEVRLHLWTHHVLGRAVLHCVGDIVYREEADALVEAVTSLKQPRIVLDLEHVRWIDAYGLGKLLYLERALAEQNQVIAFVNPSERVQELLSMTKLDTHFACDCGRSLRMVN